MRTDTLLHYEDFTVGDVRAFGATTVTRDDIVAFAQAYDPQAFHLSETAAKTTRVGELIASGFHSCAILMRLLADNVLNHSRSQGSPGIADVRWLEPVRPGDTLAARTTWVSKRPLKSRPGVGLIQIAAELTNQHGRVVMTWDTHVMFAMRADGETPP
jgi:acyl dehydratase